MIVSQWSILGAILVFGASASAQQVQIVTKQDNTVRPARCVIYKDSQSGNFTCDFFSSLGHASWQSRRVGETLLVTLFPVRPDREDNITFARGDQPPLELEGVFKELRVRLCRDSAIVSLTGETPKVSLKSAQFILDSPLDFPRDYVAVQLGARQAKETKELVANLISELNGTATLRVLSPGIYPRLPSPMVSDAVLGRRLSINRTESGYLACFEITNRDARGSVIELLRSAGQVLEGE